MNHKLWIKKMARKLKKDQPYQGFEQGPIRPPSEAYSLLIRVTRNCPWNHCTFCPVYKGTRFSIRPVDHVIRDIDTVSKYLTIIRQMADESGLKRPTEIRQAAGKIEAWESQAFQAALNWFSSGMQSIFIQDANSLIIKPADMKEILSHLNKCFPWVKRITSYARSHTITRIKTADLKDFRKAGLNRIHIGLESGSDLVLKMVKKGITKETHIKAGLKVKAAGMELSEYIMPGLGGQEYSDIHALETADALNRINPDFIRLRTLAIPNGIKLFDDWQTGRFEKCTDAMMAKENLLLIENLDGITSVLKSDHILNLFENLAGTFPDDKEHMLTILRSFLDMEPWQQCLYQVGRRIGIFARLSDMQSPRRLAKADKFCRELGVTPDNVDDVIDELMKRFI